MSNSNVQELKNKITNLLENESRLVLELVKEEKTKSSINLIMKIAITKKLQFALVEHHDKNKIYLCIDISETEFKNQAEKAGIKIDKNLKKAFDNKEQFINSVEPIYSLPLRNPFFPALL